MGAWLCAGDTLFTKLGSGRTQTPSYSKQTAPGTSCGFPVPTPRVGALRGSGSAFQGDVVAHRRRPTSHSRGHCGGPRGCVQEVCGLLCSCTLGPCPVFSVTSSSRPCQGLSWTPAGDRRVRCPRALAPAGPIQGCRPCAHRLGVPVGAASGFHRESPTPVTRRLRTRAPCSRPTPAVGGRLCAQPVGSLHNRGPSQEGEGNRSIPVVLCGWRCPSPRAEAALTREGGQGTGRQLLRSLCP